MSSPHTGFYVYLPSNASADSFPDNKVNRYNVRFGTPINLFSHPSWEAALIECSYVHNLQTVRSEDAIELYATRDTVHKSVSISAKLVNDAGLQSAKDITSVKEIIRQDSCSIYYFRGQYLDDNGYGRCVLMIPKSETPSINAQVRMSRRLAMHFGFIESDNITYLVNTGDRNPEYTVRGKETDGITLLVKPDDKNPELKAREKELAMRAEEGEKMVSFSINNFRQTKTDYEYTAPYPPPALPLQTYKTQLTIDIVFPVANRLSHTLNIRQGHYPKSDQLLAELKRTSNPMKQCLEWNYYPSDNRFSLDVLSHDYNVQLGTRLANIIGFRAREPRKFVGREAYTAELAPDLLRSTYHMYVYTDFLESVVVGHDSVPLLRAIPLQDVSYGQVKSYVFQSPMYVPVSKRVIETVEVQLRDDAGELLPLNEGKTVMVIHFRPRQA